MSEEKKDKRLSRRQFIKSAAVVTGAAVVSGSLLEACTAPAAAPTAAPSEKAPAGASPAAKTGASPVASPAAGGGTPLKIGVLLPYSGVYATLGDAITNGMVLYFESINNSIAGRPIQMIKEDEQNDPQVSLSKARKFIEQDKVDLMAGIVSSAVALAVRDLVHQNKKILVIANAGANDLCRSRKSPYIFRTSFSNWQINWPNGPWMAKNVSKNIFVSGPDYAAGHEQINAFKESFVPAGGTVVGEIYPPFPNTDYGPFLTKIADAKPEASYNFYSGSDAVAFVKQFDEFGLKKNIKLVGAGHLVDTDVLAAQGKSALGVITGLYWADGLDTPENKAFMDAYRKRFNAEPTSQSVQGYDTARVIHEALTKVNGDTSNSDNIVKAMEGIKFQSPRGPFELDAETHNVIHDSYIREVRDVNGKLSNVVLETIKGIKDPGK